MKLRTAVENEFNGKSSTQCDLGSTQHTSPFPNTSFRDPVIFKEVADDNSNVAIKGFYDTDYIENIVKKR